MKFLKCLIKGHDLEEKSIIPFIDSRNYLKRCKCCGKYVARSAFGIKITVSEREAMELKAEMLEEFPYMKEE